MIDIRLSTPPTIVILASTVVVIIFLIFLIVIVVLLLPPTRAELAVVILLLSCGDLMLLQVRQFVPDIVSPPLEPVSLVTPTGAPRPPALSSTCQREPAVVVALQLVAPAGGPREVGLTWQSGYWREGGGCVYLFHQHR